MKINYNHKNFRPVENAKNEETTSETIFEYKQNGRILTSEYHGGQIINGHLMGLVGESGEI
ncbi:hypothetical protein KUV50_02800 [Membranicola marinus]|uniref:Uncharacterized protein n=1 Tax=Membranihabitans marinus TaxID=1227546 RepID=A0A953HSE8_9BACT|nr:hypothetical protein [Membranihabitans marinus]MBY5957048.1 hypothetical protein [Membranihabitans marinus]